MTVDDAVMKVPPNNAVLNEVTFGHLTDSEKKVLLDVGFAVMGIIMNSPNQAARREAGVRLAKRYLRPPAELCDTER